MIYQTVKMLSALEAGYLAALIDGEGTITLSRRNLNKHRALVITVSSTELSILKYVQEIVGVGKITNKRITKANHTPSFTYQVANRQALDILKQTAERSPIVQSRSCPLGPFRVPTINPKEWPVLTGSTAGMHPVY